MKRDVTQIGCETKGSKGLPPRGFIVQQPYCHRQYGCWHHKDLGGRTGSTLRMLLITVSSYETFSDNFREVHNKEFLN